MHLIDNQQATDPALNLALEEYCFKHLSPGRLYLMFYINTPTVVVGKHQNIFLEANGEYAAAQGIHLMRRISGGGTVYHDPGNLNFSFIAGFKEHNLSHLPRLLRPIVGALNRLGVPARINKRNDIMVKDKKVTGTAQHTDMKMVIHHGTLLFDASLEPLRRSLHTKLGILHSKGISSVRSPVANIAAFLRHPMTMAEFREEITASVAEDFGKIRPFTLDATQWRDIEALAASKYRSWDWIYGSNPEFTVRHGVPHGSEKGWVTLTVQNGRIKTIDFTPSELAQTSLCHDKILPPGTPYDPDHIQKICDAIQSVG